MRNKKKMAALIKRQKRIFDAHKKYFWCVDGTMFERLEVGGVSQSLGGQHEKFIDHVIGGNHDWQIIAVVFCETRLSEQYTGSVHFEANGSIRNIQPEVNKRVDKLIADQNQNHFVSWGWWATPAGNVDLDKTEAQAIEIMASRGAFDRALIKLNMDKRLKDES